jgi:glycosyltransferase involved in cell wall biosynthesis
MQPLISILIPAYNAEHWLADSIQSAVSQSWPKKEIIVVDDGSKDQTLAIARQFASSQVSVVTQPNQGAATARNKALSLCQGDYIQWLDADDFLASDKITAQMSLIDSSVGPKTLLSSAWCKFYFRPYRALFIPNPLWKDLSPVEWMILKMETGAWMAPESWLVSRHLTDCAGLWNVGLSMDDDGEYFSRIIRASDRILFAPQAKTYKRESNLGSLSKSILAPGKMDSQFQSNRLQIAALRSLEDSQRVRTACLVYLQRWLIFFYPEHEKIVKQAHELAAELGGKLETPALRWKYVAFQRLFGWEVAKRMSFTMPKARTWLAREWDRMLSCASR